MLPLYKDRKAGIEIYYRQSRNVPPHVHETVELIYVASGTLDLCIGNEIYHMEKGDFGLIFPNIVHSYQVAEDDPGKSLNIIADAELAGTYYPTLQKYCPENPVIKADDLHPDVFYAIQSIPEESENADEYVIRQAFLQIVIARCLQTMKLVDKSAVVNNDLTYQTVCYISAHFAEDISLTSMARDLYVSPYALSRIFSSVFHTNFNGYLNEFRLDYAIYLLRYTTQTITEVYESAGFNSQRTFNRVFQDRFRMSPRDYREEYRKLLARSSEEEKKTFRPYYHFETGSGKEKAKEA
jgi:AraC-like DNA-binding protein/uncharacterized cupin superfamily protein